jgi:hypothetical protein
VAGSCGRALALATLLLSFAVDGRAQTVSPTDRGLAALYERLETALLSGKAQGFTDLLAATADKDAAGLFAAQQFSPGATRAAVRERDREGVADTPGSFRLLLEVFVEFGRRGSVRTWTIDVQSADGAGSTSIPAFRIVHAERVSSVDGLYRLFLSTTKQYRITNLTVRAEDLTLTMAKGTAHAVETDEGTTGFVLLGDGDMLFAPTPTSEKGQVRIIANDDVLKSRTDGVFIRMNPYDFSERVSKESLVEEPVDGRSLRRAESIFVEESGKSFGLDLSDLSREAWSLIPPSGDFLAEIRTARFGTLTYARSGGESEDVSLFDRKRRRNISVYASKAKLAARGSRYYSEDSEVDYDVEHYNIQVHIDPRREWIEGKVEVRARIRAHAVGTVTLRLAEPLVARSVVSPELGRLLSLRVKDQNALVINLPRTLMRGEALTLVVAYGGRLAGTTPEREIAEVAQEVREEILLNAEPRLLYSHRSYWYPQSTVTDYATAMIRVTVPDGWSCVATGLAASGNPVRLEGTRPGEASRLFVFNVARSARYFAVVVSHFDQVGRGVASNGEGVNFDIVANPRQVGRGRQIAEATTRVLSVYADILGEHPYQGFTLALVDDPLPGGHSPAYFAVLHQPLPSTPYTWRNDPVAFESFPHFFLAHEIAHQFWGNAVGWENYHEQWISEGFAQYLALLYAERTRSRDDVEDILRKLRQTALANSRHGPIWLGYRLGHLQSDGRIFRALVYNKSALVLHMLRRWVGDGAFFRGLRRLYLDSRFLKIGTGHVQQAFAEESGQSLERFFDRWIGEAATPVVAVQYRVEGGAPSATSPSLTASAPTEPAVAEQISVARASGEGGAVVVTLEQRGEVFDVPVTVTLQYASGQSEDVLVKLSEAKTELRLPLKGALRTVEVNRDSAALVEVAR